MKTMRICIALGMASVAVYGAMDYQLYWNERPGVPTSAADRRRYALCPGDVVIKTAAQTHGKKYSSVPPGAYGVVEPLNPTYSFIRHAKFFHPDDRATFKVEQICNSSGTFPGICFVDAFLMGDKVRINAGDWFDGQNVGHNGLRKQWTRETNWPLKNYYQVKRIKSKFTYAPLCGLYALTGVVTKMKLQKSNEECIVTIRLWNNDNQRYNKEPVSILTRWSAIRNLSKEQRRENAEYAATGRAEEAQAAADERAKKMAASQAMSGMNCASCTPTASEVLDLEADC